MKTGYFILAASFLIFPVVAQGAGIVPCGGEGENPCTFCYLFVLLNNIIKFLLIDLVPPIAVLMLVVGGIMYFFGGPNPSALNKAMGIMKSVVIGLVIAYTAWIVVNTILTTSGLAESESLLKWYDLRCE